MSSIVSPTVLGAPSGRRERRVPGGHELANASRTAQRRQRTDRLATLLIWSGAALALLPLALIIGLLLVRGSAALSVAFFTELPDLSLPSGGGIANAIAGSALLVGIASLMGLPIGIAAGLHLATHPHTRLSRISRYLSDVLNGVPSIVIGVFAWEVFVRPVGHFSAWAGGLALAVLLVPLVARTTETVVSLVPVELTEAALALGFPRWRTSLQVVLRTALPGIVTGALVAVARIAGETAPLLFTAFGNAFWSMSPDEPIAALPLTIYAYAGSPYEGWQTLAWGGALVLLLLVAGLSVVARLATRRQLSRVGAGR
ncbi:MAG: phosphate ABC transporter permease PstA [Gemmatimonadaceae bacterium]|jgi:phosphate transport system permease protein|nr:phosphate ABC transporter permease PstA [Gemmatimonadaceae bacterium]